MYTLTSNLQEARDHVRGHYNGPVELVLYGDFLCSHCGDVYPIVKRLLEKMGSDIKFIFRHYPMHKTHPLALDAALAAEAAALQGKFWDMHDMIFDNQKNLLRSSFSAFASCIDMDIRIFENSLGHKQLMYKVLNNFEQGLKRGVDSTPTFFINGKKYNGFDDFDSLYRACRFVMSCQTSNI